MNGSSSYANCSMEDTSPNALPARNRATAIFDGVQCWNDLIAMPPSARRGLIAKYPPNSEDESINNVDRLAPRDNEVNKKSGFFGYPVAFLIFAISYLCILSGCPEPSPPGYYPLSYMVIGTVVEKGSDSTIANAIVAEKLPGISDSLCIYADTLVRNDSYYIKWSSITKMYHKFVFDYRQNATPDYLNFRASAPGYHYWKYDAARDTVFKLDGVDSLCIRLIKK